MTERIKESLNNNLTRLLRKAIPDKDDDIKNTALYATIMGAVSGAALLASKHFHNLKLDGSNNDFIISFTTLALASGIILWKSDRIALWYKGKNATEKRKSE